MLPFDRMICLVLFLWFFVAKNYGQQIHLNVNATEVFSYNITPDSLSWDEKERGNRFRYNVISTEGPDLPYWLYTKYFSEDNSFFIFGAPPRDLDPNILELQVTVTSLLSYRYKYCKLIISIRPKKAYGKYEIYIRVNNVNIKDMLNVARRNTLIGIFENNFWRESVGTLYSTFLAASEDVGFRLPSNPNDTAGVVLHLGSAIYFSDQLINLQNETLPLSKNCPSVYKRITVERFFRPKNFIVDWCFFKLVTSNDCSTSSVSFSKNICDLLDSNNISGYEDESDEEFLIDKEKVPQSPAYGVIILLVIIPSIFLGFIIASWLASFMCFNNAKLNDPYSDDYFETIFFICEDLHRTRQRRNDQNSLDDDDFDNAQSRMHFLF